MKMGVIGAGAVGLLFAFYLSKAGAAVTVYTRNEEQAKQLQQEGIRCVYDGREEVQFPTAVSLTEAALEDQYLFVAVKQYDIEGILPYIEKIKTRVIFLQNGMAHIPILHRLQQAATAVGIVEHGAKKEGMTVFHTGLGVTRLGIVTGEGEFHHLLPFLQAPQFLGVVAENWEDILRRKLIVNVCINPLTALYRVRNGELLDNPFFYKAMEQVFMETAPILGQSKETWEIVCAVCRNTAQNHSSMLRDVTLRRQTEIDAIVGYVLSQASEQKRQAPLLSFLYQSIKGMSME